ncbi:MAG: peptidoglycan editing factor PgeF [Candidatus Latescibacteria bacterium]|nr:peptidoglycan editing factor PgeF [Candidatus Latescibacterota bacterium]
MAEWVLQAKQGVKYYELDFQATGHNNLLCLFFTKIGGLKFNIEDEDKFASDIDWVKENFHLPNLQYLKQIHSNKILYIADYNFNLDSGDGLYTDQPEIFLSVRTADCLPIYFIVPDKRIAGLVHSGWQGTLKQISLAMIRTIQERYQVKPEQISYAFGPSIGQCCYEIKQDTASLFKQLIKSYKIEQAIIERDKKIFLDIKLINQKIFDTIGLNKITDINLCSCCYEEQFYSARRGDKLARNLSLIGFQNKDIRN